MKISWNWHGSSSSPSCNTWPTGCQSFISCRWGRTFDSDANYIFSPENDQSEIPFFLPFFYNILFFSFERAELLRVCKYQIEMFVECKKSSGDNAGVCESDAQSMLDIA